MIVTTLLLSFLLSFLPLVIGTLAFRYQPNLFSRGILTLSAVSFLIGLGQFGLLLVTSYKLIEPAQMKQAYLGLQYVSIAGGAVMILAGFMWVGYFRQLMQSRAAAPTKKRAEKAVPVTTPAEAAPATAVTAEDEPAEKPKAPRKRREKSAPTDDWFADQLPTAPVVKLAAVVTKKKVSPPPRNRPKPPQA